MGESMNKGYAKSAGKEGRAARSTGKSERSAANPHAPVLDLQRNIGNRAVTQLLQSREQNVPPAVDKVVSSGGGQALDPATRGFMEERFGQDFGGVRVHTDSQAAESARSLNAHAYTVGHDVVFGAGRYQPETGSGKQLLAHELAHVVQQGKHTAVKPRSLGQKTDTAESQAKQAETSVINNRNLPNLSPLQVPVIQRAEDQSMWEVASESWGKEKQAAYKSIITTLRGLQSSGLSKLRALTKDMTPVQQFVAEQIIMEIEMGSDILISLSLAIIGLITGFVKGIAAAVWGLLLLIYNVIAAIELFCAGLFSEQRREEFDQKANTFLDTLKNIGPNFVKVIDNWKERFDKVNPDEKTLMIGELTGEIEAFLATIKAGGQIASQTPKLSSALVPAQEFATTGPSLETGGATAVNVAGPGAAGALTVATASQLNEKAKSTAKEQKTEPPKSTKKPESKTPNKSKVESKTVPKSATKKGPAPLKEHQVSEYGRYNIPSRVGDGLEGHEILLNSWLKQRGLITRRGAGLSRFNSAIALTVEQHEAVSALQRARGLYDEVALANMSAQEIIARNAQILLDVGIPEEKVLEVVDDVFEMLPGLPAD